MFLIRLQLPVGSAELHSYGIAFFCFNKLQIDFKVHATTLTEDFLQIFYKNLTFFLWKLQNPEVSDPSVRQTEN